MKYKKLLYTALLMCATAQARLTTSTSYFASRQHYDSASPELVSLKHDLVDKRECGRGGVFQLGIFGSRSSDSAGLAKYFLPCGKTKITAAELGSQTLFNENHDVVANYFGVFTADAAPGGNVFNATNLTFESTIKLCPRQSVVGIGLSYQQRLSCYDECNPWWFSIDTSIARVKNDLKFKETIVNAGGGATPTGFVDTMAKAFKGETIFGDQKFKFSKIDGPRTKWGLADIDVKIGYQSVNSEHCTLNTWGGVVIPTGTRPKAEFMFEPIVGNGKHFGVMFGNSATMRVLCDECKDVFVAIDTSTSYLFSAQQKRSFDMKDKQWSRFIWIFPDNTATPIGNDLAGADIQPGINFFTRNMCVKPRASTTINVALYMHHVCGFEGEVGYNFFARQCEEVKLSKKWELGPGIAGFNPANTSVLVTKSHATIKLFENRLIPFDVETDGSTPRFVQITEDDLDLDSAAHPCMLSHIVYASVGYAPETCVYPTVWSAGGSYEFSSANSAMDRWTLWGKFAVSF